MIAASAEGDETFEAHLLDHGLLRVGHLSGPEFEIASMVRAVGESDWAAELTRIVEEIAPDQLSGDPNGMKFWSWEKQPDGTGWATMTFQPKTSESGSEEARQHRGHDDRGWREDADRPAGRGHALLRNRAALNAAAAREPAADAVDMVTQVKRVAWGRKVQSLLSPVLSRFFTA